MLDVICQCFIEDFCVYVHMRSWSVVFYFFDIIFSVLIYTKSTIILMWNAGMFLKEPLHYKRLEIAVIGNHESLFYFYKIMIQFVRNAQALESDGKAHPDENIRHHWF